MDIRDPIELRKAPARSDESIAEALEPLGLTLPLAALGHALSLPSGLLPVGLRSDMELLRFEDFSFTTPGRDSCLVGPETAAHQRLRYALEQCHHSAEEPFPVDGAPESLQAQLERPRLETARLVVIAGFEDSESGAYCPIVASLDHASTARPLPVFVLYMYDELFWRYLGPSPAAMVGTLINDYLESLTRLVEPLLGNE